MIEQIPERSGFATAWQKTRKTVRQKKIAYAWDAADSDRSGGSEQGEVFIDCLLSCGSGAYLILGSASSPFRSVLNEIIRRRIERKKRKSRVVKA